jgi:uncharacterized membrane protein
MMILILACATGQKDSASTCEDAQLVEWNYWADGFFSTYCNGCHSSQSPNRYGAPEEINFDSETDVLSQSEEIYNSVLVRQSMPKGGGMEDTELDNLRTYLNCWGEVSQ